MLVEGKFPWKDYNTGDTVTESEFQNIVDGVKNADKRPLAIDLYKEYLQDRNVKEISSATAGAATRMDAWTTLTDDATYATLNNASYKCLVNTTSYPFYNGFSITGTWNFLQMDDGKSYSNNYIVGLIAFYVSDITKFERLRIRFGTNPSNCYQLSFEAASLQTGYNLKALDISAVTTIGSPPALTAITYIDVWMYVNTNALNAFWCFDHLQLQLINTEDEEPWPLQVNDSCDDATRTDLINRCGYWYMMSRDVLGIAWSKSGFIRPTSTIALRTFDLSNELYRDFFCKMTIGCKTVGKTNSIVWYVDANNYVECYVNSNTMYCNKCIAGTVTTTSKATGLTLVKNNYPDLMMYKINGHVLFAIKTSATLWKWIDCYHPSTEVGYVTTGQPIATINILYNWVVSHYPNAMISTNNDSLVI